MGRDSTQPSTIESANRSFQSEAKAYRLGFRSDIEGLRAVAIILVVAAHAGVPWLKGGFIGVDVFFVLSGYLITGLLIQEIGSTGSVRMLEFYARRLKRLLPALLFMVLGTTISAAVLLVPFEQIDQAATASPASVWLSNIIFAFSDVDYFSPSAETNLFLHTWSLGVEEQFYLVWPMLLLFLLGACRWQGCGLNFRRLTYGMAATFVVSLVLSVLLSKTLPLLGFYLMPSRAWQFALGALVLLWSTRGSRNVGNIVNQQFSPGVSYVLTIGGWVGLSAILVAAILLHPNISYPGAWALVPSVGAALVLGAGSAGSTKGVGLLLSTSPMQGIGRISYSWYLWHWPVLILGKIVAMPDHSIQTVLLVGLSLALAVFTYLGVEAPIRQSKTLSNRAQLTLAASMALMLGAIVLSTVWERTAVAWSKMPEQQLYQKVQSDLPALYSMGCDEWFYNPRVVTCIFGPKDAEHTAVLIGDSVATQWFPAIASIFDKPGW